MGGVFPNCTCGICIPVVDVGMATTKKGHTNNKKVSRESSTHKGCSTQENAIDRQAVLAAAAARRRRVVAGTGRITVTVVVVLVVAIIADGAIALVMFVLITRQRWMKRRRRIATPCSPGEEAA